MPQPISVTASFSDGALVDVTPGVSWRIEHPDRLQIATGTVSPTIGGRIYGRTVPVTASLGSVQIATSTIIIVPTESGSRPDGTDGYHMPMSEHQWGALGLSPWGAYGGMQEGSGNLVLSGSAGYTLETFDNAGASVSYRQSLSGLARKAITFGGDNTNGTGATAAAGVGPDLSRSWAMLAYAMLYPSTDSTTLSLIGAQGDSTLAESTVKIRLGQSGSTAGQVSLAGSSGSGVVVFRRLVGPYNTLHMDRIHPYIVAYNSTTGDVAAFTDDAIATSGSVFANIDATKGIGHRPDGVASMSASITYFASCTGSLAESVCSISGAADLLSRLGWNVRWKTCPVDSGSIKIPFLPSHWAELGLVPWAATNLLQEPSGSNMFSFDRWDGTLVGAHAIISNGAGHQFLMSVPGWTRKAVSYDEGSTARFVVTNAAVTPTGSVAYLAYLDFPTGSSVVTASLFGQTPAGCVVAAQYYPTLGNKIGICLSGSSTALGVRTTGALNHADGRIHPALLVYDATNSRAKLYSDLEIITGSFKSLFNPGLQLNTRGIGGIMTATPSACSTRMMYFAVTTGTLAESLSDDGKASAFLKALGWNPPW